MKEVFKKIRERLEERARWYNSASDSDQDVRRGVKEAIEIVNQVESECNNGWIPCSERLPEEHDSLFAMYKGTNKWDDAMFEKISDVVNVTVVDEKGKAVTTHAHTTDGIWHCDLLRCNRTYRIIAWQPLPEPYKGE